MNKLPKILTYILIFIFIFTLPESTKKIESGILSSAFGGKMLFIFDKCDLGTIIQIGTNSYLHLPTTKDYDEGDPGMTSIGQYILGKTLINTPMPCTVDAVPVYTGKPIKFNGTSG